MTPSPVGAAFTDPADGDMRGDLAARHQVSSRLGIAPDWATAEQVHGAVAVVVDTPGRVEAADGLVTTRPGLPVAVFTADCLGIVLAGPSSVAVAHAGWRGILAGVITATVGLQRQVDGAPLRAWVGPGIGPCCFEVGDEVAELFPGDVGETTWGTTSVDLRAAAARELGGTPVTVDHRCTACGGGYSHRRQGGTARLAALGWVE